MHAFQISTGLGAGNIGDELMARAFWRCLPLDAVLDVPLFPESERHREPYPPPHRYLAVDWHGNENSTATTAGLLVGGTSVSDAEGLHWPMQFLAPRLRHFHERGLPVDAVGIGIDRLQSKNALELFNEHYAGIRSWTVRSPDCRDALLSMGVPDSRIRVGADWAWLYRPRRDLRDWARDFWLRLGIDPARPLLMANVVNMIWREAVEARQNIADALDQAARAFDLQIAFFCNECRPGDFFDFEAARQMAALMVTSAIVVPNEYFASDEALALMQSASVCVTQRYHFMVQSVLAGVPPVGILRGQKMRTLIRELSAPVGGFIEHVDSEALVSAIAECIENRAAVLARIEEAKSGLISRAACNLSLVPELCAIA